MTDRKAALILLFLTALLWSTGGLLIKWIDWHPLAIAGMRSAITAIFLWSYLSSPHFVWSPTQIGGGVASAAATILFVIATKLTTAANAALLLYTAPIYVALFSAWFLQEKVTRIDWLTMGSVIGGMILFFLDKLTFEGVWGNICAILGGMAYAWMVLTLRKQKSESPLETILLGSIITGLAGFPFFFDALPTFSNWVGLVLLGTVQLGIPYILYVKAIKNVSAMEAILILGIEPVLNPVWVFLLFGETPGLWAITGGIIVLLSVTTRGLVLALEKPFFPLNQYTETPKTL